MVDTQLKKALLDWSNTFTQISLNDLSRYAHSIGLSLAQMSILMHLHYHGACEVTRFSDMLQISRPAASQMIERLVQQGVVQRYQSQDDRRVRLVDLTKVGRRFVTESLDVRVKRINDLVDQISTEDQTHLVRVMTELTNNAKKLEK